MSELGANKALVPKLRFPGFHAEWEPKTLASVCQLKAGDFVRAEAIKEHSGPKLFPCYGGNGLRGYVATFTHDGTFPLIGRQGALCGNVQLAAGRFHATEHAVAATPRESIDVRWLSYTLTLMNLNKFATGQAQPGLSVEVLNALPLPAPESLAEQRKIAECLESLDELIDAETEKLEALKRHKKGLLQQLLPSEGETTPRLRFPQYQNAPEWKIKTLQAVATIRSGTTPSRANAAFFHRGTVPWVKTMDLNNSEVHHTGEKVTESSGVRVNPADSVLVAMYGGFNQIGRTGILMMPAATNQAIAVLIPNADELSARYLLVWLNANVERWKRVAASSRKDANITSNDVGNFEISFPEVEEQIVITNSLETIDRISSGVDRRLTELRSHKVSLMQQLFPSIEE